MLKFDCKWSNLYCNLFREIYNIVNYKMAWSQRSTTANYGVVLRVFMYFFDLLPENMPRYNQINITL